MKENAILSYQRMLHTIHVPHFEPRFTCMNFIVLVGDPRYGTTDDRPLRITNVGLSTHIDQYKYENQLRHFKL
jgi:hypothetical protein